LYRTENNMLEFDKELIKKLKQQDHNAFNAFYLQTVDTFFRYINANYFLPKQDVEDIISDFYVKRREAIKSYDEKLSFTAYFRTIFKNIIKDHFKKSKDLPFTTLSKDEENDFSENLMDETDLTSLIENDYKFEQIQKAIKKLDDLSKDIIYFKFIEEKSHEEIAIIMWISNDNIRQKISRAIKYLKNILESDS